VAKGTLRFLGHAFFEFVTDQGKVILVDPWTQDAGNPSCPLETDAFQAADLVLVSHDHFDHAGSALDICRKSGALLGGVVQTAGRLMEEGLPEEQVVNSGMGFNIGGGFDLGWVKVTSVQAFHSSDTGVCAGLVMQTSDGTTIYHAGDTGLFGDMELIGRLYPLDVALVPIGGVFTMDPFLASQAVKMLKPKLAVPMHYASFPVLVQSADEFLELCGKICPQTEIKVLQPGESLDLD